MTDLYELEAVSRSYPQGEGQLAALCQLSLRVALGELCVFAGPSGCGKSTLLHILGLLDSGFSGQLRFAGWDVAGLSPARQARVRLAHIGFVFQSFHLLWTMSVWDNVALPYWRLHGQRGRARRRAADLLEQLGLAHRLKHDPRRLSGGEMQRVAVARALINDPLVLLADEPTGNLDAANAQLVTDLFTATWRRGKTIVCASHDQSMLRAGGRIVRLNYGRLAEPPGESDEP